MNNCNLSGPAITPEGCPLARQVSKNPDAVAIMAGELYWTWQELDHRVQDMACGLIEAGVESGQVLAVSSANSPMLVVLTLACLRAGIIILPLNPRFPEDKIQNIAEHAGVSAFWSDDNVMKESWSEIMLPDNLHNLKGKDQTFQWDDNRVSTLVMTSGSSGLSKAVAHNFSCHRVSAQASQAIIPLTENDSWLLSLPLYHIGGLALLFRCLLSGASIVFPDHRSDLAQTLIKRRVTHVSMVNTQLYRLLNDDSFAFGKSEVSTLLMGGGYVSGALAEQAQAHGVKVLTTYGMTEMGSQICTGQPSFLASGALTSGSPLPHCEVNISGRGEIRVRGASLFLGYWHRGVLNRPITDDGWFCTGDTGIWFGDQIQINGRIDNQFISGGENIQPETIERVLLEMSDIEQAIVVPVSNLEYGRRPVAFVQSKNKPENEVWRLYLKRRLPGFMVPDQFLPWPDCKGDMKNSSQLKVNRRKLEKLAEKLSCHEKYQRSSQPVSEQTMMEDSDNAVSASVDLPKNAAPVTRAFIAYMLPLDLAAAVHKKVRRFGPAGDNRRVRWTPPQNYHLTLRFLGDSSPEQLHAVAEQLRQRLTDFQPFVCMSGGVDYLPSHNHPRVMTLKIHSGRRMEDLHSLCEDIALKVGFGPDKRLFRPHVTLARTGGIERSHLGSSAFSIPWRLPGYRLQVGEVALVSSELSRDGSRYKILESFPLA
ncbi:o-succinylbenzoate--CoA ligase [Parendozoicomonas sp. Alg238-R29]|uniref:o-succinylbenzoate--CoA ligase n=1 Tax=Parendozoicomonas sp. Alg238-R29 TaxID=2993446 RepID=UPI00248D8F84|nr:o-succinylbenzoate--CoA ligase [Parendozoicomonas sp. Alg238-R29]